MKTIEVWRHSLFEARDILDQFVNDSSQLEKCVQFSVWLKETFERKGRLFTCGNGGSHCDAMHFAEEWTGRYRKNRRPLGALALGESSHITCVSNDFGFEHIFSRQLEGLGRAGDMLVGLSTSGNSLNVIRAFEIAKKNDIRTVGLLGRDGGTLKDMSDLSIVVPAKTSDRIQEMHIKIIHSVIEAVEREMFPENY
ncbi:MAG: D-sedoheptulose 7-phosphate isomerase [Bdellovibrionales bacterium]|nr:D-sedoheptulose 7-phosphate isomerase [Bdellovibrionales bacterium]